MPKVCGRFKLTCIIEQLPDSDSCKDHRSALLQFHNVLESTFRNTEARQQKGSHQVQANLRVFGSKLEVVRLKKKTGADDFFFFLKGHESLECKAGRW